MKSLTLILGCLIFAALFIMVAKAAPGTFNLHTLKRAFGFSAGVLRFNALTSGTHKGGLLGHLKADAAHSARYLLVKRGSDVDHFALGTAADMPLGVCIDEPSAAEEPATIGLLGATGGTCLMVGNAAIAADADVYSAANGKVGVEPTTVGTYWLVGRTVDACAADGGQVEVNPCKPIKVVVIANAANLATTQAAMATPALVKVLGA